MAELREALSDAGFQEVRTYLQSGNVVLRSQLSPGELEAECEALISQRFELDVPVVVRTGQELGDVVARDPLGVEADDPKRYQVTFLERRLDAEQVGRLESLVAASERLVVDGREIYAWHPKGIARSALWSALSSASLGVKATARNWTTVTALLAMARGE